MARGLDHEVLTVVGDIGHNLNQHISTEIAIAVCGLQTYCFSVFEVCKLNEAMNVSILDEPSSLQLWTYIIPPFFHPVRYIITVLSFN